MQAPYPLLRDTPARVVQRLTLAAPPQKQGKRGEASRLFHVSNLQNLSLTLTFCLSDAGLSCTFVGVGCHCKCMT